MESFKEFLELAPGGPLVGLGVLVFALISAVRFFKGALFSAFLDMVQEVFRFTEWEDVIAILIVVVRGTLRLLFYLAVFWYLVMCFKIFML